METQVLTVSSKGQISLPINIRKKLSIDTGDKLAVYASEDAITLKVIKMPTIKEFERAMKQAQQWAKTVGLKESDINDIIKTYRKNKRK